MHYLTKVPGYLSDSQLFYLLTSIYPFIPNIFAFCHSIYLSDTLYLYQSVYLTAAPLSLFSLRPCTYMPHSIYLPIQLSVSICLYIIINKNVLMVVQSLTYFYSSSSILPSSISSHLFIFSMVYTASLGLPCSHLSLSFPLYTTFTFSQASEWRQF